MSTKPIIAVAFYSTYGHIGGLAEEVIKGVEETGAIAKPYVIQETLPKEVLDKMYAGSSLTPKYPILTPNDLKEVDGLILGAPTRYGRLPAQVDAFFDATGGLWAAGTLVGKFFTMFTSTAGQHSGQESTFLTTFPFVSHHGMAYVPIGYANQTIGSLAQIQGGTPYGASTIAGADGSRQPLAEELEVAHFQGKYFANFVTTFVKGKKAPATTAVAAVTPAAAAPAATSTANTTTAAAAKDIPALAAPLPVSLTAAHTATTKEAGYTVDSTPAESTAAATPTGDATSSAAVTGGESTPAKVSEKEATPAPAPAAATKETTTSTPAIKEATTPAAAPPAKKEVPKKKKGFFASCCGDSGIDK